MSDHSRFRIFVITALALAVAAPAPGRAKEGDEIVIGAVLPSTPTKGDLAPYAAQCKAAFEMAAADFKAATGKTVRIVYRDSNSKPETAAAAARALVEREGVSVILGEVSGTNTAAMVKDKAVKGKALVLSPLAATPQLVGIDPMFFSVWPSDTDAMKALAAHFTEKLGMKRVAVIVQDSPGAEASERAFREACAGHKAEVRLARKYPKGKPDLAEIAAALKRAEADLDGIVLLGWATEMGQVARAVREAGIRTPLGADLDFASAEALEAAGKAADGVIFARPVYDPRANEAAAKFADRFARGHDRRPPELEDACAYDAVTLIASGMAQGHRDAPALAKYLSQLKGHRGASGAITFDDKGLVHRPYELKTARYITLGSVLPLSGEFDLYGKQCRCGLDLALAECNARLAPRGLWLALAHEDGGGDPDKAVAAADGLIKRENVPVIFGEVLSEVTLRLVRKKTAAAKVLLFSPASSSPELTGVSPLFLRNWPSDTHEAAALAEHARGRLGVRSVAVVFREDAFGRGLKNAFVAAFTGGDGESVTAHSYPPKPKDLGAPLAKALASKPDAVFLAGYPEEMGPATRQLRQAGFRGRILANTDYGDVDFKKYGRDAEGVVFATPAYNPNEAGGGRALHFVRAFRAKYGADPSILNATSYDALHLVTEALLAGHTSGVAIARYLAESEEGFDGAAGWTKFKNCDPVGRKIIVNMVKGGDVVPAPKEASGR